MKIKPNGIYNNALSYLNRNFKQLVNKLVAFINHSIGLFFPCKYQHTTFTIQVTDYNQPKAFNPIPKRKRRVRTQHASPEITDLLLRQLAKKREEKSNVEVKPTPDGLSFQVKMEYIEETGFKLGSNRK